MRNRLFLFLGIFTFLISCEDETDPLQADESSGPEFVESTIVVDGREFLIEMDMRGEEPLIVQSDDFIALDELINGKELTYYVSADFDGFAVFSSSEKLNETLSDNKKLADFNDKMISLYGTNQFSSKSSGITSRSTPSFTIAKDLGLKGTKFTRSNFGTYANPHLRCNQYETGCSNYNDKITSIEVVNAVAEFYSGSFRSKGSRLYVNALNGRTYIGTLKDYRLQYTEFRNNSFQHGDNTCRLWTSPFCKSWNDKITSFWASQSYRASGNNPNSILSQDCSHNYSDPSCSSGGGGGGGSGGGGGGGNPVGGDQPIK